MSKKNIILFLSIIILFVLITILFLNKGDKENNSQVIADKGLLTKISTSAKKTINELEDVFGKNNTPSDRQLQNQSKYEKTVQTEKPSGTSPKTKKRDALNYTIKTTINDHFFHLHTFENEELNHSLKIEKAILNNGKIKIIEDTLNNDSSRIFLQNALDSLNFVQFLNKNDKELELITLDEHLGKKIHNKKNKIINSILWDEDTLNLAHNLLPRAYLLKGFFDAQYKLGDDTLVYQYNNSSYELNKFIQPGQQVRSKEILTQKCQITTIKKDSAFVILFGDEKDKKVNLQQKNFLDQREIPNETLAEIANRFEEIAFVEFLGGTGKNKIFDVINDNIGLNVRLKDETIMKAIHQKIWHNKIPENTEYFIDLANQKLGVYLLHGFYRAHGKDISKITYSINMGDQFFTMEAIESGSRQSSWVNTAEIILIILACLAMLTGVYLLVRKKEKIIKGMDFLKIRNRIFPKRRKATIESAQDNTSFENLSTVLKEIKEKTGNSFVKEKIDEALKQHQTQYKKQQQIKNQLKTEIAELKKERNELKSFFELNDPQKIREWKQPKNITQNYVIKWIKVLFKNLNEFDNPKDVEDLLLAEKSLKEQLTVSKKILENKKTEDILKSKMITRYDKKELEDKLRNFDLIINSSELKDLINNFYSYRSDHVLLSKLNEADQLLNIKSYNELIKKQDSFNTKWVKEVCAFKGQVELLNAFLKEFEDISMEKLTDKDLKNQLNEFTEKFRALQKKEELLNHLTNTHSVSKLIQLLENYNNGNHPVSKHLKEVNSHSANWLRISNEKEIGHLLKYDLSNALKTNIHNILSELKNMDIAKKYAREIYSGKVNEFDNLINSLQTFGKVGEKELKEIKSYMFLFSFLLWDLINLFEDENTRMQTLLYNPTKLYYNDENNIIEPDKKLLDKDMESKLKNIINSLEIDTSIFGDKRIFGYKLN